MGLRETVAKAAASAFAAVGDIPETATLTRTSQTYDAAAGAAATSTTTYGTVAIFTSFSLAEADKVVVLNEDKKAIIRQSALAVTPLITDMLSNAAGKKHQIVNIKQDPAGATWTLHLRAVT